MRLIDAELLVLEVDCLETCRRRKAHGWMVPVNEVCRTIVEAPTIDAVPVVRCKDCKYYEQDDDDYECEQGEDSWGVCENTGAGMMRCGYCSDGERKDDENMR